jgi:ribonuclease HII
MIETPDLAFEKELWRGRLTHVAGLDEAGRGALAGPVAVGAVILPPRPRLTRTLAGVRDSKLMTPLQRARWAGRIRSAALAWQVGFASAQEIDALGIVPATRLAALRALAGLGLAPDYLLTDFRLDLPELDTPQTSLVKGDRRCLSIAAASVLAKTARDALLCELDSEYPGYELERHKGYGTAGHRAAIGRLGHSPVHRRTFVLKEFC